MHLFFFCLYLHFPLCPTVRTSEHGAFWRFCFELSFRPSKAGGLLPWKCFYLFSYLFIFIFFKASVISAALQQECRINSALLAQRRWKRFDRDSDLFAGVCDWRHAGMSLFCSVHMWAGEVATARAPHRAPGLTPSVPDVARAHSHNTCFGSALRYDEAVDVRGSKFLWVTSHWVVCFSVNTLFTWSMHKQRKHFPA